MIWQYIYSNFYYILAAIIILCIIGFEANRRKIIKLHNDAEFSRLFLDRFKIFIESTCTDNTIYGWLVENSTHMQELLGADGIVIYREKYLNWNPQLCQVIVDFIPSIHYGCHSKDYSLNREALNTQSHAIYDGITKHIGIVKYTHNECISRLRNPFLLVFDGWFTILNIPIAAANKIGIIGHETCNKIKTSNIYKIVLSILAAVGVLLTICANILSIQQSNPSFFPSIFQIFTTP